MEMHDLLIATFGIALGGFLKGATGFGAPVVGVPILALVFGVQEAIAVFSVLNLISNVWQSWTYKAALGSRRFVWGFSLSGAVGAVFGSALLASLHTDILMASLALMVFLYIGLRLARPDFTISRSTGERLATSVGFAGGVMQGAGGISAPVSITFLHAMKLERLEFVATIAVFFLVMSVFQVPALAAFGILTWERLGLGIIAALPLFGAMPAGAWAAQRVSRETFNRIILWLLAAIAVRLLYVALT